MTDESVAPAERGDELVANMILRLVTERGSGESICPSEVARALAGNKTEWRALMLNVRRVAGALAAEGRISITQRGAIVDVESARGAIRLSLRAQ